MSYLSRFLEIGGFLPEGADKTDRTPFMRVVSSVLSVDSGTDTEKSAAFADPTGPPVSEPTEPVGSVGPGPPPSDRRWRAAIARWPLECRERWGRRANEHEAAGATWTEAEWIAYSEMAPDMADAERRREFMCAHRAPGLSDPEAVATIELAFSDGDPAPAGPSGQGPRDVLRGDRWLPWHFDSASLSPPFEPADDYDREERAAIRQHGGG
jgi:hypothetical protein